MTAGATGEALKAYTALNNYGGVVAGAGGSGLPSAPKAFITILLFDQNFNFVDVAFDQIGTNGEQVGATPKAAFDLLSRDMTVKEPGYAYIYVSNENPTQVDVYFDDLKIIHNKSNVIQYNEYYPFGMQNQNSWTRENTKGNNFLYNQGNELNTMTGLYETFVRSYDPAIGRFHQVDPLADSYGSQTTYNYANNDPVYWNDVTGALAGRDASEQAEYDWYMRLSKHINPTNGMKMWTPSGSWTPGFTGLEDGSWGDMVGNYNLDDLGINYGPTLCVACGDLKSSYTVTNYDENGNVANYESVGVYENVWVGGVGVQTQSDNSLYFTGTAPYNLYNGALRIYYQNAAAGLKDYATRPNGSINYLKGSDARLSLKIQVRALTLAPQRTVLNSLDVITPSSKSAPRFWLTNKGWNAAGKLSVAGGVIGLGLAGYRVASADDQVHETGKVAAGFAGAWIGMQAIAPLAAGAGALSGPFAPFVSGGILIIGGTAGALGAEWLFDKSTDR